jgi:hypothetical protein
LVAALFRHIDGVVDIDEHAVRIRADYGTVCEGGPIRIPRCIWAECRLIE